MIYIYAQRKDLRTNFLKKSTVINELAFKFLKQHATPVACLTENILLYKKDPVADKPATQQVVNTQRLTTSW